MPTNDILASLNPDVARELIRSGRESRFGHGTLLCRAKEAINDIVFPVSGLVSLVVELEAGDPMEVAMLGHRCALGGAAVFGAKEHIATALGQIPGVALLVPVRKVTEVSQGDELLRSILLEQEQFILAQAEQMAACNGQHSIQQRVAGWLLRARSITGSDELTLTHEYVARMIGVQRTSVSIAIGALVEVNAIEHRRGQIRIVASELLNSYACECHRALEERRRRLFAAVLH